MICYFSATGNSKHTANLLADSLNDTAVSVLDMQGKTVCAGAGERFVLVYPNYCGGVPSVIADFLQKGKFALHKDARLILVVTYGNNTGASGSIATKYFKKNTGREFDALFSVKMPDNWTPVFDLSDSEAVDQIAYQADEEIEVIIRQIQQDEKGDFIKDKLGKFMEAVYPGFYKGLRKTSHLQVGDSCIGCGQCERLCPVSAIEMSAGKPTWVKDHCVMCLGCLHRCPKFAIQYDNKTQNHGQYLHPDERM